MTESVYNHTFRISTWWLFCFRKHSFIRCGISKYHPGLSSGVYIITRMDRFPFFVILLTFSVLLPVFVSALDRLEIQGFNLSPHVGSTESVEFQCTLDQQECDIFENGGILVWLADGQIIANSSLEQQEEFVADQDKYNISLQNLPEFDQCIALLNINHISVDDSKEYRCALFSAQSEKVAQSRPRSVTVHYAPDQLYPQCTIDSTPTNSKMVTLTCKSQTAFPNVRVNWTSPDGSAIGSTSESDGYTESKFDVEIPIVDTEYVCVLNYSSVYENLSRMCKVYPPQVSLTQPEEEVVEGGNAVFTCSVSAKPESLSESGITWKSFRPLKSRNITTFNNDRSDSQLKVNNVTSKDNGTEIMCHYKNLLGENHQRAILIVKTYRSSTGIYVPPFKVTIEPQIAHVSEGDIASFKCDVSTYKNSYMYKWYFKDEEIDSESMPEKFSIEQTSQRLRVLSVDDADNNATVACVVMADGEKKTARATLLVIEPPAVDTSQEDSPDDMTEVWKLVIPISGGLVSFSLVVLLVWISCKTKRRCGDKNDRGHVATESVAYVASNEVGQTPFNNSPLPVNGVSRATTKTVNHNRFLVNLPPVPPIPTEDDEQDADALRVAMKLGELEDYEDMEDMERARSNYYHQHENEEHNQYQHVIDRLEKPTNHQENDQQDKQGGGEPLY